MNNNNETISVRKRHSVWSILSIISLACACITFFKGIDKMVNYDNGDYYPYELVNAYVGGDAYNYIINGTYSTAFFVLTTMFVLASIGLMILHYVSKKNPVVAEVSRQNPKSMLDDIESNLPEM